MISNHWSENESYNQGYRRQRRNNKNNGLLNVKSLCKQKKSSVTDADAGSFE